MTEQDSSTKLKKKLIIFLPSENQKLQIEVIYSELTRETTKKIKSNLILLNSVFVSSSHSSNRINENSFMKDI